MELQEIKEEFKVLQAVERIKNSIPSDIRKIHALFKKAGFKLYLVGGAVRDALMGDAPKDFDLATDAKPDEIKKILKDYKTNLQGESFGVVVVYTSQHTSGFEIATFRQDISKGRKPEVKVGATIDEDVLRRDLTLNALFFDLDKNEIVDLVGGVSDLHKGIIRTVGEPKERFDEDRLRLLRAVRFAARYNGTLDKETEKAIINDPHLHEVSPERITEEVVKAMKHSKSTYYYFSELNRLGLLTMMFPECNINTYYVPQTKSVNVALAVILTGNDLKTLSKKLVPDFKYSIDTAESIKYLIEMYQSMPMDILPFYRKRAKTNLTDDEILQYAKAMENGYESDKIVTYALAYIKYKPVSNAQKMMDEEGFSAGAELGLEIKKRENEYFNKLLKATQDGTIKSVLDEN